MADNDEFWELWKRLIKKGATLSGIEKAVGYPQEGYIFQLEPPDDVSTRVHFPVFTRVVAGVDIVKYSARSDPGRLYLTSLLYALVESAILFVQHKGWGGPPEAVISTGDGAFCVYETPEACLAFVFALQMFLEDVNRGGRVAPTVDAEGGASFLPCEVRYAVVQDRLLRIKDLQGAENHAGEALVKCARVLAMSHGAHLLLDDAVMDWALGHGGINELGRIFTELRWRQELHIAKLARRAVKGATYDVWNVFGMFSTPEVEDARRYAIGSHDVSSLS